MLAERRIGGFDYLLCAAGEHSGRATLFVPEYRHLPLTGEASFLRDQRSSWLAEAPVAIFDGNLYR